MAAFKWVPGKGFVSEFEFTPLALSLAKYAEKEVKEVESLVAGLAWAPKLNVGQGGRMSAAKRLQARDLLRDSVSELRAALARRSPDAAYWYARSAASAARLLPTWRKVPGCACVNCDHYGGICLASLNLGLEAA